MANRKTTKYLVIHVTATPPGWNKGAAGIRKMHLARGWRDIGYNEVINPDGSVERGRGIHAVGAHVAGFNSISYGVSMVGGVDKSGNPDISTITTAQWTALRDLMKLRVKTFPEAVICGHRDLSPDRDGDGIIEPFEHLKACPCFDAIPWAILNSLPPAPIKGTWTAPFTPVPFTPGSRPIPTPDSSGPDERDLYLQKLLSRAGYEFGALDGIVGPNTKAAIRRFQRAASLKVTGTFDEPTVSRLRHMFEAPIKAAEQKRREEEISNQLAISITADLDTVTFGPLDPEPSAQPLLGRLVSFIASLFRRRDD